MEEKHRIQTEQISQPSRKKPLSRREFLGTAATVGAAFTLVPRHVLGGPGYQAPSDKIILASIGTGGQGLTNIRSFLRQPSTHFVAVADVN